MVCHHNFCKLSLFAFFAGAVAASNIRPSRNGLKAKDETIMSTTLPLFWHLSSAQKKERIDASVKLVGALEHFQARFVPREPPSSEGTPEGSEDEDDEGAKRGDGLDVLNAQDVSYSVRRLVRGLASPRESSRLGFAVALTEVRSHAYTHNYISL